MKRAIALTLLVEIGACKAPVSEQRNAALVPDRQGNGAVIPGSAPSPARSPIANGRIPAAFQGRWGLVAADCTSTRGDNKGLMTVTADRLTFYESRASVASLATFSPTELRATLAFSGEGQTWKQETPLTLEDNGKALTRVADGQTLRYSRCPA